MGWSSRPGVRAPTELALWGTVRALVARGTCPRTADPSLIVRSPRRVAREVTGRGADGERWGAAQLAGAALGAAGSGADGEGWPGPRQGWVTARRGWRLPSQGGWRFLSRVGEENAPPPAR